MAGSDLVDVVAKAESVRSSLTGSPDEATAKVQSDEANVENGATLLDWLPQ